MICGCNSVCAIAARITSLCCTGGIASNDSFVASRKVERMAVTVVMMSTEL